MVSRRPSRHQLLLGRHAVTSPHPVVERGIAPLSHGSYFGLACSATGSCAPAHRSPPPPSVSLPLSLHYLPCPSAPRLCTRCPLESGAIAQPAVGRHESNPSASRRSGAPSGPPFRL